MNEQALRIESKAEKCLTSISHALQNAGITDACYAVRVRVKSEDRLKEKVTRKLREGKADYNLESITDVIGIRLITLFRSEIPIVLEKVLDLIDHQIPLLPHPLEKDSAEELIVYSNQLAQSPFISSIKERLSQRQRELDLRNSDKGYSSLHVVCRISTKLIDCTSIAQSYSLPVEIQIRTVFEDAWGEIDHKYGYLVRTGKDNSEEQSQALTAPHLLVLKEFTEACASYADAIKQMRLPSEPASNRSGKVIAVQSDGDILARFASLKVPDELIKAYRTGRELRESGANHNKREDAHIRYLDAHSYFEELHKNATDQRFGTDEGKRLYLYYIALNSAYCLLSLGTPNSIDRAIQIYNRLAKEYAEYPMVRMRLSQALAKAGRSDEAILMMENVQAEVETKAVICKGMGSWSDSLPESDHNYICKFLPKLLGYAYWAKAVQRTPSEDVRSKLALIRLAIEATLKSTEPDGPAITNNLAFFSVEYLKLEENDEFAQGLRLELPKYEAVLEAAATSEAGSRNLRMLDTLLELYTFNGADDKAMELAKEIGTKIKEGFEQDGAAVQRISQRVIDVLTKYSVIRGNKKP